MWQEGKERIDLDEKEQTHHEITALESIIVSHSESALNDPNLSLLKTSLVARLERKFLNSQSREASLGKREKQLLVAKSLASILGLQAGIPYLNVARGFANSTEFGWLLGICITASNAALTTWSLLDLIDNLNEDLISSEEVKKTDCKRAIGTMQWLVAFTLGISSALPSTYIGYKYNNESLYWGSILFLSDSSINTYSMSRLITRSSLRCCRPIDHFKALYIDALENGIYTFISQNEHERFDFLKKCGVDLNDESTFDGKMHLILSEIGLLPRLDPKNKYLQLSRCSTEATKVFGCILPLSWMVVALKVSYDGSKIIYDDPYFNAFIAVLAVSPSTLLEMALSGQVYFNLLKFISSVIAKMPLKAKSSIMYPRISLALNAAMLAIAMFSFGARAKVTIDNFSGVTGAIFEAMVIMTTMTYKSFSIPELIDKILIFFATRNRELANASIVEMLSVLNNFKLTLGKCSDQEFIDFLQESDSSKVAQMLDVDKAMIEDCRNDSRYYQRQGQYPLTFFKKPSHKNDRVIYEQPESDISSDDAPRRSRCPTGCMVM